MFAITQNTCTESREGFLEEGMAKLKDEGREAFFRPKKQHVQGQEEGEGRAGVQDKADSLMWLEHQL